MIDLREHPNLCGGEVLFQYLEDIYFFKKDLQSKFTGANDHFLTLCGVEHLEQILGKSDRDFFPKHMADRYNRDDDIVMQTGKSLRKILEVNAGPQGIRWLQTTKAPLVEEGKVVGLVGMARDVRRSLKTLEPYDILQPAIAAIEQDLLKPWRMEELAETTHLSLSQFERRFKRAFGISPKQYILQLRLDEVAANLKKGKSPLAQLAVRFGFHDQSHLTRHFKTRFGCSPSRF